MIQPVNKHLLIQPVKHDSFIANQQDTYEEIGVVLAADPELLGVTAYYGSGAGDMAMQMEGNHIAVGDKVYFDAWLAAKFPGEKEGEFYWLVKWEDVRAVEYAKEEQVSE